MKKFFRRYFNLYNVVIVCCIVAIIALVFINVRPQISSWITAKEIEKKTVTEDQAKQIAVNKLKELGEEVKAEELKITKIERNGNESYYITSPNNTLEVEVIGGAIIRLNGVVVNM